ncbi:glycosyltransferase family 2 protein [Aestuariibius sp. HNIBRBA575]|uniref:glycosyltransferase family 2 protein n=1 Tax=Aestuariibius sp. HNIBRBA575 TaxID=3233343 RepID=UPI0034A1D851
MDFGDATAPPYELLISIINYKTAQMTLDCLNSVVADLDAHRPNLSVKVVVIDNASHDGSAETIDHWIKTSQESDRVTLIQSDRNTGFSGGHNLGLTAARAKYYLILNSDAVLRPNFCSAILNAAQSQPEIGLFAPRLEHEDGQAQISCFRFASILSELDRGAKTGLISTMLRHTQIALGTPPDPTQIEWASFACILLSGKMLGHVGLMDDGYFLYFEDSEYCLRAARAGWKIAYIPDAVAVHFRGGSAPVKSLSAQKKRLPGYYYASRTRFLYQRYGHLGLLAANIAWSMGRGIAWARLLLARTPPKAHQAEWRDIWTNFSSPLGASRAPE